MMLKTVVLLTISALGLTLAVSMRAGAEEAAAKTIKTGYALVNGLNMYYEIHGSGEPLIILHGGLGSTDMFSGLMPALAKIRQVIAVDLQGHGRTADVERPMSYQSMADDIAALMRHFKIQKADILGYSLGGGVAVRTAIQHPECVNRLVVVSTVFKLDGWYPEVRTAMSHLSAEAAEQMKPSPLYQSYARVAPRPADWPVLVTKLGSLIRTDFDWSKEVGAIQAPTLLVFGDADAVRPEHAIEFFQLLGGGKKDGGWDGSGISKARLAILPGVTHYNMLASPHLGPVVTEFLTATSTH